MELGRESPGKSDGLCVSMEGPMASRKIFLFERRGCSSVFRTEDQELIKYQSDAPNLDYLTGIIRLKKRPSASLLPPSGATWPLYPAKHQGATP